MWDEMQWNNGETKVLEPLLEPLAKTPLGTGTLYSNLAGTPFQRWNPCWNPLVEPLSALKPFAGTLLEPSFCARTCAGTPAGIPFLRWSPCCNPPLCAFGHFWEFYIVCGPSQLRLALYL